MLQFRSSSQSLPSEQDRDGDILLLSQRSVNGKQVQSGGKGKEKARLTSSPLEDIGVSLIILLIWIADHRDPYRGSSMGGHLRAYRRGMPLAMLSISSTLNFYSRQN